MLNLVNTIQANTDTLPPQAAMKEYIVAGNGLFVRAEDSRISALIPVAPAYCQGLELLRPHVHLLLKRIPANYLHSVLKSARKALPAEVMYQFYEPEEGGWACRKPAQATDVVSVAFEDDGRAVVDLHSHNTMNAFFSGTDDKDEAGFRLYCVIGKIDTDRPEMLCRVGVYGHHWPVPVTAIFDGEGPFVDLFADRRCRECGCTDEHGCANGCWWVEPDLCSNCVATEKEIEEK